jgi:hypothetical protein
MACISAIQGPVALDLSLLSINGIRFADFKDRNYFDHPIDRLMGGRSVDAIETIDRRWRDKLWDS